MKMRKQRLMGVGLIVISWLVLLLACTESESPEDNDATAVLLVAPLGLYMLYSDTYLLYDGEPRGRARDRPEADPWAPSLPEVVLPSPLYPYESPFYCKATGKPFFGVELPSVVVSYANPGGRTRIDELKRVVFVKRSHKAAQGDKTLSVDIDLMIVGGIVEDGVEPV